VFIVSKCLIGQKSKYNGGDNLTQDVVEFTQSYACLFICPETAYLPIPRDPAEIIKNTSDSSFRVINKSGIDVTREFLDGAIDCIREIEEYAVDNNEIIEGAVLKSKSPSCGCGEIYDGSFSHNVITGNGVFVELLLKEFESFTKGEQTMVPGVVFSNNFQIANESNLKDIF